jgi:hypothetical protein
MFLVRGRHILNGESGAEQSKIGGDRAGADDTPMESPAEFADRLPSGRSVTVAGDHLRAPYDPAFARMIVEFLDGVHGDR